MPLTTLTCPNCGGALSDECRGAFPLYHVHADYLCPHCDTVLRWVRPKGLPQWFRCLVLLSATLPCISLGIVVRDAWNGISPTDTKIMMAYLSQVPLLLILMLMRPMREPWMLMVRKDPFIWKWQADEQKLRSKHGSYW